MPDVFFTIYAQTHQQVIEQFLNDLQRRKVDLESRLHATKNLTAAEASRLHHTLAELDSLIWMWTRTKVEQIGGRRRSTP